SYCHCPFVMLIFTHQVDSTAMAGDCPARKADNDATDALAHDIVKVIKGPREILSDTRFEELLRGITGIPDLVNDRSLQLPTPPIETPVTSHANEYSPFHGIVPGRPPPWRRVQGF